MVDSPAVDRVPSQPTKPTLSSSVIPQPPPPQEIATEGGQQGGDAAGQADEGTVESTERIGTGRKPTAPPDPAETAAPLPPPPPSHFDSATPAPPAISEPVFAPTERTLRPSAPSAAHSRTPEPDKFSVPYSDAARAAQSASRWNGLLSWARGVRLESSPGGAERGWDFATGMYHVPRNSPYYTAGVERAPLDPSRPPPPLSLHQAAVLVQHNPDALSDDDGTDSAAGSGFHESGRPRRSRAAMGLR